MVTDDRWWHDAVGYEIYVRSFSDGDGDGVGDLPGITARLDHLVALGIDLVWLTPFYTSPMADFGYDVADYCGVDPSFGDIADLEKLVAEAHARALRVVVDIVPNHCSDQHPWFQQARADPAGPHRDYFIWRDPGPDGGPPNNWVAYFGGSAWTLDDASGQYYLHLFLPEQPDLNWRNPAVQHEFHNILRFWLDLGVDGFRIDVAQALEKDRELRSNPQLAPWDPEGTRWEQWEAFDHQYDIMQPESLEVFASWRVIADSYDALLLGETHVAEPGQLAELLRGDGLHAGFWFSPIYMDWDAADIRTTLRAPGSALADPRMVAWVSSSHDDVRPPTRFGGGELGRQRALALSTLLMGLPGVPFLYQGEELGLVDGVVPQSQRADPVGADVTLSRDGCRTPMPWEPGVAFGFSTNASTWLPHGGRTDADTAARQRADDDSWFHRYRRLIEVRRAEPDLRRGEVAWLDLHPDLVAYRRGELDVVANVGVDTVVSGIEGSILYATTGRTGSIERSTPLAASEAVVIRRTGS